MNRWYRISYDFYKENYDKYNHYQYELGIFYEKGICVERNLPVALKLFEEAACFGSSKARQKLEYYKTKQNNDMVKNMPGFLRKVMFKIFGN